jgi:hypothetical protein
MSLEGQSRRSDNRKVTSGLPPRPDVSGAGHHFAFAPFRTWTSRELRDAISVLSRSNDREDLPASRQGELLRRLAWRSSREQ